MRILLTNDDGIYAPGLRALRKELMKIGEVIVVAPATEQSATGHSVTLLTPLLVTEVFDDADQSLLGWAVEGRPEPVLARPAGPARTSLPAARSATRGERKRSEVQRGLCDV